MFDPQAKTEVPPPFNRRNTFVKNNIINIIIKMTFVFKGMDLNKRDKEKEASALQSNRK